MALRLYVFLFLLFLFFPICLIVLFAFHATSALSFPFSGFSLRWFQELLSDGRFLQSLKNSVLVATSASLATCVLGTLAALALPRLKDTSRAVFSFMSFAPIALPGLFLGAGLLVVFERLGIYRSLLTITIGHILFCLPFFIQTLRARVAHFDTELELAARDLGATPVQAFRLVTLPILGPTVLGATMLAFALSFDEIVITVFVVGEQSTLPFYIFSLMRRTITPTVTAASVLAMAVTLLLICVAGAIFAFQRRSSLELRNETMEP